MTYDFSRYNQYQVLRLNWLVWGILLYMTRHTVLITILLFASGRGRTGGISGVLDTYEPIYIIADIPVLILFSTLGSRLPGAGRGPRFVWRHGRHAILTSVVAFFAILLARNGMNEAAYDLITWLNVAATLAVGALVLSSQYLKDLFAEFPAPQDTGEN